MEIGRLEATVKMYTAQMSMDPDNYADLAAEYDEAQKKLEAFYEKWDERLSKNTVDGMKTGHRKQRIGERAYGASGEWFSLHEKNYFPTLAYTWYNKLYFRIYDNLTASP